MPLVTESIRRYPPALQRCWAVSIVALAAVLTDTDRRILALLVACRQFCLLRGATCCFLFHIIAVMARRSLIAIA
jgi:hypothetical protein